MTTEYDPLAPPADPYPVLDAVHARCPVAVGPSGPVLVTGYDAVQAALSRPAELSNRSPRPPLPGEVETLIHLDNPEHDRVRRLINRALPKRLMAEAEPGIAEATRVLLDEIATGETADLVPALSQPLPAVVFCQLLGVPAEDRLLFLRWADDAIAFSHTGQDAPTQGDFVAYVRRCIDMRRAEPGDDLLSRLVHTREGQDRLSDAELVATVRLLLVAGTETTTNLISTLMHQMLTHRDLWEQVAADEALATRAVEEALRLDAPLSWIPRLCVGEGSDIAGTHIPPARVVAVSLAHANHDATVFPDPHSYRLDRPPSGKTHVAFGHATHFCIGAPLARTEARVALVETMRRFPALRLADDFTFAPRGPLMMRGVASLPVVLA